MQPRMVISGAHGWARRAKIVSPPGGAGTARWQPQPSRPCSALGQCPGSDAAEVRMEDDALVRGSSTRPFLQLPPLSITP